jgi:hypothetical protein
MLCFLAVSWTPRALLSPKNEIWHPGNWLPLPTFYFMQLLYKPLPTPQLLRRLIRRPWLLLLRNPLTGGDPALPLSIAGLLHLTSVHCRQPLIAGSFLALSPIQRFAFISTTAGEWHIVTSLSASGREMSKGPSNTSIFTIITPNRPQIHPRRQVTHQLSRELGSRTQSGSPSLSSSSHRLDYC